MITLNTSCVFFFFVNVRVMLHFLSLSFYSSDILRLSLVVGFSSHTFVVSVLILLSLLRYFTPLSLITQTHFVSFFHFLSVIFSYSCPLYLYSRASIFLIAIITMHYFFPILYSPSRFHFSFPVLLRLALLCILLSMARCGLSSAPCVSGGKRVCCD